MRLWVVHIASIVAYNKKCQEQTELITKIFQEGKGEQDDRIEPKDIIL